MKVLINLNVRTDVVFLTLIELLKFDFARMRWSYASMHARLDLSFLVFLHTFHISLDEVGQLRSHAKISFSNCRSCIDTRGSKFQ